MNPLTFLVLAIVVLCAAVSAQQEQQQQVTLTREKLDQLLQLMTPICRTELEGALASQGQISTDCRAEIQSAFQTLGVDLEQAAEEGSAAPQEAPESRPRRSQQAKADAPEASAIPETAQSSTTILAIVAFLVALAAALGGYVVYVNSQRAADPEAVKKAKKLSKKKEEKLKQKGVRVQG